MSPNVLSALQLYDNLSAFGAAAEAPAQRWHRLAATCKGVAFMQCTETLSPLQLVLTAHRIAATAPKALAPWRSSGFRTPPRSHTPADQ